MNVNSVEDGRPSSRNRDETDSPRKRMRLDNTARKSWSLTDRRTDQEVLQEMGVSLLEPDENETVCDTGPSSSIAKSATKRKYDIENVNPNINSNITSPRSKFSPKSPKIKCSPSPGPSRIKSPRSSEKSKPLQPSDQQLLETTLLDGYFKDEETPLEQTVSAQYHPSGPKYSGNTTCSAGKRHSSLTPLGIEEELIISRRSKTEPHGDDAFAAMSDEMMLSIFKWLPKRTLAHCMLVCKRWHRVACDETLWQRLDLGNKTLSKDALGRILSRKPIIVRLASSQIGEWHPTSAPEQSRIQYLDLSMCTIDLVTLKCLLERCSGLKKLSLESVGVSNEICEMIGRCSNLETLNLTIVRGLTTEGMKSIIEGCPGLQSLNVAWCNMSEETLKALIQAVPQRLQRLNMCGARNLTDDMVKSLVSRCTRLLELDLSDCSRLTNVAVMAIIGLTRLEHLAISRCYFVPPHTLTKVSSMPALQYLEVWGMLQNASLNALRSALPAIQVNQFMFSAIARPTVGTRRTSIWGLRTRD